MKVENDDDEVDVELRKIREIAKFSSIYYRNLNQFERDKSLSHVVHAVMNFGQFLGVLSNEVFHHVHHVINRNMREKDWEVPELPEERNLIFFAYPICMTISLILAIMWLRFRTFQRIIDTSLAGCAIGILVMLLSGIMAMRHAEMYINLDHIPDEELLNHPIFMHNFFLCILSIFAMLIYLIHFWILYDCWRWRKKAREWEITEQETSSSSESRESSRSISEPEISMLDEISPLENLKRKLSEVDKTDLKDEPVILYCCCVDCWRYFAERDSREPLQEFQLVHVK